MRVLTSPVFDEPPAPLECYPVVECSIRVDDIEISSVLVDGKRCVVTRRVPEKEIVMWVMGQGQIRGYSADQIEQCSSDSA